MPEHANVIEALAAIMAELPAIAKMPHPSESGRGLTYAYRGIEEITAHAQQLFAKHGVVVVPQVHHREVKDIIVNGNPWTDTFLEVYWSIYGAGGVEDVIQAATFGQGRDNSDKGTNKAMTQAFKYLLLDMLMISDPSDDGDGTNIEVDARTHTSYAPAVQEGFEMINGERIPTAAAPEIHSSGPPSDLATPKQVGYARKLMTDNGINPEGDDGQAWVNANCPPWPGMLKNLSKKQASTVIELLK